MEPLMVDVLHFYPRENAQEHNTARYEVVMGEENPTTTVLRRGQPFNGVVRFTRPYDELNDLVQLVFTLGDKVNMDTQGSMFLRQDAVLDDKSWGAKLTDVQGDTVSFQVMSPATAPVGNWSVRVVTRTKSGRAREIYDFDQDFYILFNPWIAGDQTYMEDPLPLQEYVLNDIGKIWLGPIKQTRGRAWMFGQFDGNILPACMFVLDRANIPFHKRGDPVKMTRAISQIVNSNDDEGVLVGRWDNDYEDGTAPNDWTNSVDILEQYLKTEEPVRYGQCWVFAGVTATVCRALGIPCRVVTNVVSAHDANSTLTVDKFYNENMEEMNEDPNNPNGTVDSIWNYHVWNDVWMARPDLPPGYGGWQAIDATPQELSGNVFQCGPAPLEAIKQGVLGLNYDVEFMMSSVNADVMRWRIDPDAEIGYSLVDTNQRHIGRMILTKKLYVFDPLADEDREDIISQYKHQEDTSAERVAFMTGVHQSERAKRYYSILNSMTTDVKFKLHELDVVQIGNEFRITMDIENTSDQDRNIKASLYATSMFYNGVRSDLIKKKDGKIYVGPRKREQVSVVVKPEEYLPKLVIYSNIKISAMALVDETKQAWANDDDFQITKPNITVKTNQDMIVNETAAVQLSFTNPLNVELTGCKVQVSSQNIMGRVLRAEAADVPAKGPFSLEIPVLPNKIGKMLLIVKFTSKELNDLEGRINVEVFEA